MIRRVRVRNVILGIAVLIGSHCFLNVRKPAFGQYDSEEVKQALKERDRLEVETQRFREEGKTVEAISAAKAMLAIERRHLGAKHLDVAGSLVILAELYTMREDYAAASKSRREVLAVLRQHFADENWQVIDARWALHYAEILAGLNSDQRLRLAEQYRLERQVLALSVADKSREAVPVAKQALAIQKELFGERQPLYANSLVVLAALLRNGEDYAAARLLQERILTIQKELLGERHPAYADSVIALAHTLNLQGSYDEARALCERGLAIQKEVLGEQHSSYVVNLGSLASLLVSQGDYVQARSLYEQVLNLQKRVLGERHPAYADTLISMARLFASSAGAASARPLFEQGLMIQKEVLGERDPSYAANLGFFALLRGSQGDYAGARELLEQALAIQKGVFGDHHRVYATTLSNLAWMQSLQGNYAAARELFERVLAINKEIVGERHLDYSNALYNLAMMLHSQGDTAAALPLCERVLALESEDTTEKPLDYATRLTNVASLYFNQGNYTSAAPLSEKAVQIVVKSLDWASTFQTEMQQMATSQYCMFNLSFYLTLVPHLKIAPTHSYARVLACKGAVFERQRHLTSHRRLARDASGSENARLFKRLTEITGRLSALALATTDDNKPVGVWRDEFAELTRRKDELEMTLAEKDAVFREARSEARRSPEEIQRALPPGTALIDQIEYIHYSPPPSGKGKLISEVHVLAFVVRPDRPIVMLDLGPREKIAKAVEIWRASLLRPAVARDGPAANVSKLVWEPLERHLDGVERVLFSPDGVLASVPFAALPGKAPESYLIEERSVCVVPVPRTLGGHTADDALRVEIAPTLLLVGDVEYGGDPGTSDASGGSRSAAVGTRGELLAEFRRLPATGDEVASIARNFRRRYPGVMYLELDGPGATEEAVRREAPRHRYLHLATHGYFAPPNLRSALGPDPKTSIAGIDPLSGQSVSGFHPGLLAGIALAGANRRRLSSGQDDGILTALEVAQLDLSGVELAVLSACETGLGEVAGGEGLLGLQRAFQVAGAHSVVASLWTVDDEATRALMARFYENLWRKGRPPAEALREAQLSMLRGGLWRGTLKRETDGPNSDRLPPLYWAAFVLSTNHP